ncbi:MAG: hypothetical protein O3C63_07615 [Cyanobacteria bacterium]|nr:hypothetical protein [Cyanobacteriota bacterium]
MTTITSFNNDIKREFKELKTSTDSGQNYAKSLASRFADISESTTTITNGLFHETKPTIDIRHWFETNVIDAFKKLAGIPRITQDQVAAVTETAIDHLAAGVTKAVAALHQANPVQINDVGDEFQKTQRADNEQQSYWIKDLPPSENVATLLEKLAQGTASVDHFNALANVINPNPNVAIKGKVAEDPKLRDLFTLLLDKVKQIPNTDFAQFAQEDSQAALFRAIDISSFAPHNFNAKDWNSIFNNSADLNNADFMQIFYSLLQTDTKIAQKNKTDEPHFSCALRFLNLVQG